MKFFSKGKYDKALVVYLEVVKADPKDLSSRLKLGDLYRRVNQLDRAIQVYTEVADFYARDGLLLKAIAALKLILEIDESHTATQGVLADLYSQKYGSLPASMGGKPIPSSPPPPQPALAPGPTGNSAPINLGSAAETIPLEFVPVSDDTEVEVDIDLDALEDEPVDLTALQPPPMPEPSARAASPAALPTIPLFSDLSKEAFVELMVQMTLHHFAPGDIVISQGEVGDSFFIVAGGQLRVYREDESGKEIPLAVLGDGHFFGEMALLSDAPRSATVEAVEESEVFELSRALIEKLGTRYPTVEQALRRFCRQRMVANLMSTSPVFRPFDKEQRRELIRKFNAMEVPPGEVVVREGHPSEGLYLVMTGEVVVTRGSGFEEVTLARLTSGAIFGEMSLINHTPATASVKTLRQSTLLRLPPRGFSELMMTHPQILEVVSQLNDERSQENDAVLAGVLDIDEDGLLLI